MKKAYVIAPLVGLVAFIGYYLYWDGPWSRYDAAPEEEATVAYAVLEEWFSGKVPRDLSIKPTLSLPTNAQWLRDSLLSQNPELEINMVEDLIEKSAHDVPTWPELIVLVRAGSGSSLAVRAELKEAISRGPSDQFAESLMERYFDEGGFEFSRVGFSKSGDAALVAMGFRAKGGGMGLMWFLRRSRGNWKVQSLRNYLLWYEG